MQNWWNSVSDIAQWIRLFDALPEVCMYAKDLRHRFTHVNGTLARWYGLADPKAMLGRVDADFQPPALAEDYVREDLRVLESGKPLLDQVWLVPGPELEPRWYLSSKFPLFDRTGRVAGLAGVMRPYEGTAVSGSVSARLGVALREVLQRYGEKITVPELAALCNLSVSQFQRDFRRCFHRSPSQYILEVRLQMARRLLERSDNAVGVVALECGFFDQAHFTRAFTRAHGVSPSRYRRFSFGVGRQKSEAANAGEHSPPPGPDW